MNDYHKLNCFSRVSGPFMAPDAKSYILFTNVLSLFPEMACVRAKSFHKSFFPKFTPHHEVILAVTRLLLASVSE